MAWWLVERWEALRLALGARGALAREVGTLIPPPRVPIGALAPPTAPPPRLSSRGTGKPRTHCAARVRSRGCLNLLIRIVSATPQHTLRHTRADPRIHPAS